MNILEMINMSISILSGVFALGGLIIVIIKWLKNGNAKKVLALISTIPELVKQAEQMFGKGHGKDKFKWVFTMLRNQALQTKTKVADSVLENSINDIVDTTNNVNVDKFPFSNANGTNINSTENQTNTKNIENNSDVSEIV